MINAYSFQQLVDVYISSLGNYGLDLVVTWTKDQEKQVLQVFLFTVIFSKTG